MSDRDEFGAFLVGFVVGTVTGAMASLLLAPQSGEQTRDVIKERAIELREKASSTVDDAYSKAQTAAEEAKESFESLAKLTKERAEELRRRGTTILEEQKEKISNKADAANLAEEA